jgi:tetratricopeptide (TPR) repeat protein
MIGRLIVLVLALAASTARAAPSQEELARSHFVAGEQEYARGRWQEALHEFQLGYALSPRPEFLINFAQVYRKLGDYDAAARECRRYLATAPPPELAAQAERLLQQIDEERAQVPPPAPPPKPAPVVTAPLVTAPVVTAPVVTAPVIVAPPPAPPPKNKKRTWIAPVVISCVVVAAAAVTVGVVFGLPPRVSFKSAPLGTVDFR